MELRGQTVVVGGTSGIGLEIARRARSEGANVVAVSSSFRDCLNTIVQSR